MLIASLAIANVWVVPDSLSSIQVAIDTAASGDTVLVTNPHQNEGPVEINGKTIALLSKSYINNPSSYNILSGAALFDSLNTRPLLKIINSNNTIIKGFLFDQSDVGNGGGVLIENSNNVILKAVYFKANPLYINNSSVMDTNSQHVSLSSNDISCININNSLVRIENSTWKTNTVPSLLVVDQSSELYVRNLASYSNVCSSTLYDFSNSYSEFNFITSYKNTCANPDWNYTNSYVLINNSILQNSPPMDIAQCEIFYSSLPDTFPGIGNIFTDPMINTTSSYPNLLSTSPCISAANPDTNGIPRYDLLGNTRPNPAWAPPDMGAYESERHLLFNDNTHFWISTNGDDVWGNGSLQYPFAGLQAAANYAESSDTLLFQPGSYSGYLDIDAKSLVISSEYIYNQDSSYIDSVILMPDTGIYSPIVLAKNVDTLRISGLSFKNGTGRYIYNNYSLGGAIYLENSSCFLDHILFENNQADFSGGAIFANTSYLEMENIKLKNNRAYVGGAITLSGTIANMAHTYFTQNIASSGGAIFVENNSKLVSYYTNFENNIAFTDSFKTHLNKPTAISQYGGAVYATNSDLRFNNALFHQNLAKNKGGAFAQRGGNLKIIQSTFADNQQGNDTSAVIYLKDIDSPIVLNSILWNLDYPEIEIQSCDLDMISTCLEGGMSQIQQNDTISTLYSSNVSNSDPLFNEQYNLSETSPCIEQGLITYVNDAYYLLHYQSEEFNGAQPDLGYWGAFPAISYQLESYVSNVDPLPETYHLLKAYPNPFNPVTTLEFSLQTSGKTELLIYNVRGEMVKSILNTYLTPGVYAYTLNAEYLASGVYICKLKQNDLLVATQKILLVK